MPRPFVFVNEDGQPLTVGDLREFVEECTQLGIPDSAEPRVSAALSPGTLSMTDGTLIGKLTVRR